MYVIYMASVFIYIYKVLNGSMPIYGCDLYIMHMSSILIFVTYILIYVASIKFACDINAYWRRIHIVVCCMHKYVWRYVKDFTCIFIYIANIFCNITCIHVYMGYYIKYECLKFFFECDYLLLWNSIKFLKILIFI